METKQFEIGEVYVFDRTEYIPTRETGKLVFLLKDMSGEPVGRTVPFDFQSNNYPEKLTVVYRGEGKFEQLQSAVLDQVYKIGETYPFKVWRERGSQGMLLRDEVNGLTHANVWMPGGGNLKRFTEVNCKVTDISEEGLQLHYQGNRIQGNNTYTIHTLINDERLRQEPWIHIAERVMEWEVFSEARETAGRGDVRWVAMALQTLVRLLPQWLSEAPLRRGIWVERLAYIVSTVVESGSYAAAFNYDRQLLHDNRKELGRGIEQLEYMKRAISLVVSGKAEDMIESTLETMGRGWVYRPAERVGVLMQVLALAPGLGHSHTGDVFNIIRKMHNNHEFMKLFNEAFKMMLLTYIESERAAPDPLARGGLRELAVALAIELLLTADEEFEQWDTHRGTLYTIAALLTGHSGEAPFRKAMLTYCGLNDTPLEFTWDDLHDINRVCYKLLASNRSAGSSGVDAVFEGESMRLRVDSRQLWLQPAVDNIRLRTELEGPVAEDMRYAIQLPEKLKEKGYLDSNNLSRHRSLWRQVRQGLEGSVNAMMARNRQEDKEPAPGDIVEIIVVGQIKIKDADGKDHYEFECRSLDGRYTGSIGLADIVPYPVNNNNYRRIFYDGSDPLCLKAQVMEQYADGRYRFSLRKAMMEANYRDACQDRNSGENILAKVTAISNDQYKATSELGYGLLFSKKDTPVDLKQGDVVELRVDSVNYRPDAGKLYVNCTWQNTIKEEDDDGELEHLLVMPYWEYDTEALSSLLREEYTPVPYGEVLELMESGQGQEMETREVRYLKPEAVTNLSFLLEQCAALQRDDLRSSYTLLNLSLLLADMSGDRVRLEAMEVQLQLLETLSAFAIDGIMDLESVIQLVERGRRVAATSALMRSRLKEVALLAGLDNQTFLNRTIEWTQRGADEHIHKLIQFAIAYNALEGLGAGEIRQDIRSHIHKLLALPTVESKLHRLNVSEDLYHEFKTSAIYPADNHMKPDERKQGQVIARTVASFLNTEGGTLYLGVGNAGNLTGLDTDFRYKCLVPVGEYDIREAQDTYNLYLQRTLRLYLGTTVDGRSLIPDYVDIQYEQIENMWICHITVRRFPGAVLFKPDDKLYIRRIGETVEVREPIEKRRYIERRTGR